MHGGFKDLKAHILQLRMFVNNVLCNNVFKMATQIVKYFKFLYTSYQIV